MIFTVDAFFERLELVFDVQPRYGHPLRRRLQFLDNIAQVLKWRRLTNARGKGGYFIGVISIVVDDNFVE